MQLAVRLPSQVVVRHRSGSLVGGIHLIAPRSVPGRSTGTLLGVQSQTALRRSVSRPQYGHRTIATEAVQQNTSHGGVIALWKRALPHACPGCGGLAQTVEPNEAGYYSLTRPAVKRYLNPKTQLDELAEEEVLKKSLDQADSGLLQTLGLNSVNGDKDVSQPQIPVCDRCHNLVHHHAGVPILHPSVQSIQETISESPYKHNHVYHVLDAADFPMSLVPNLHHHLALSPPRSKNRRSKSERYVRGRKADMSFIITRADLLAPKKEQVDTLMPYVMQVLRDALGSRGQDVRLGNVRCVSSKRGWWTKEVKEDVWRRGNGCWLVGKVNVGKSNLFESIFPKGRSEDVNSYRSRDGASGTSEQLDYTIGDNLDKIHGTLADIRDDFEADPDSLLPPAQLETAYPVMPVISALPGTTASPIRVPFGGGKGELIDLPGLERTTLDTYVRQEHKLDLVMRSRVVPEQQVIKPGQSLLLGGLIRITPTTPDVIFLAYAFVPIKPHLTSTEKAILIHTVDQSSGVPVIRAEGIGHKMASAGKFKLAWDVTKQRTGSLTSASAGKTKPHNLPFQIFAADILIEGCGWVEVVAQVRRSKQRNTDTQLGTDEQKLPADDDNNDSLPEVEVFSPEGKFISIRRPMNAWVLGGKKPTSARPKKARPRQSMRSIKGRQI